MVLDRSQRTHSSPSGEPRPASLSDLIQLECVSRAREAVLVTSGGRQGHLFFEGGAMVHARANDLLGDAAAFEIVSWKTGTFSASDLPWPPRPSVTLSWQALLIQAARASDEPERARSERVPTRHATLRSSVPLFESVAASSPSERPTSSHPPASPRVRPASGSVPIRRRPPALPPPQAPRTSLVGAAAAVKRAARLDERDALIAARGDGDALAQLAPAVKRAALALGEVLGLQHFRALECSCAARQLVLYRDTNHSYVALEAAPGTNLDALRTAPSKEPL
ncbi:MAG TPA: DUF4388 domain-containing protein [Polyangiaceae bacterium]